MPWISGKPLDRPECGFEWELCKTEKGIAFMVTASVFAVLLLVVLLIVAVKYR